MQYRKFFKCTFSIENVPFIKISPKLAHKGLTDNKSTVVWLMAWCWIENKSLSKPNLSQFINSLAPGKFELNFRSLIFQIISVIDGWGISCDLALRSISLDLTDDKSTLVQGMAWCRQATSHYLSHCRPRLLSPYGVTRPQWVKLKCNKWCWQVWVLCPVESWDPLHLTLLNMNVLWGLIKISWKH